MQKAINMHPKTVQYFANGTSRDTYIAHNHGGFQAPKSMPHRLHSKNSSFQFAPLPNIIKKGGSIGGRKIYWNNGQGRDNYISHDLGGQVAVLTRCLRAVHRRRMTGSEASCASTIRSTC